MPCDILSIRQSCFADAGNIVSVKLWLSDYNFSSPMKGVIA